MNESLDIISHAFAQGTLLRLVLSKPRRARGTAAARNSHVAMRVTAHPVEIRGQPLFQFTYQLPDRAIHENFDAAQAARQARELAATDFEHAALYTTGADYTIRASGEGSFRIVKRPPSKATASASIAHDRAKSYLIPEGVPCPFLTEIGVMTPEGRVRRAMHDKFRQINRFLEFVEDVVPALPAEGPIRVVDFGCGKSYLTFAVHHLLTAIHRRDVEIVGLDLKRDVVRHCSDVARRLGCRGLEFREGDIARFEPKGSVDLAVSLHACDTATDDALAQAVRWNCRAILAAPCCQHELAPLIQPEGLAALSRHGILHERFVALATDGLRALVLEICGYATQVIEFIDLEHTPKNLLIRAVRRTQSDERLRATRVAEYEQLKRKLGIDRPYLERALWPDGLGV